MSYQWMTEKGWREHWSRLEVVQRLKCFLSVAAALLCAAMWRQSWIYVEASDSGDAAACAAVSTATTFLMLWLVFGSLGVEPTEPADPRS